MYKLFKARNELEQEREKQKEFNSRGGKEYEYGPDAFPPTPFIIWARIKLADRRFNEKYMHQAETEACKEWAKMNDTRTKPWIEASEQMQQDWRGV